MRLALALFKYFPYGGLQRDMLRVARTAAARGHAVTVFNTLWNGPRPEGVEIRTLPLRGWTNYGRMQAFAEDFAAAARGFDVTYAFSRVPGADFYFAADNCLAVEIPKKHPFLRFCLPRYRTLLRHERRIFAPASPTRIFYIAPRQKADFSRIYGTPPERLLYLPPGIDESYRHPDVTGEARRRVRAEFGLSDGQKMLILVGLHKGGDRAIRALAALPAERRAECCLFLVGSAPAGKCEKLARELGVGSQVVFPGGRGDVPDLLQAADLMVHPARDEATGTVLVEGIALGLPVLCSGECGFSDFVEAAGGKVLPAGAPQTELNSLLAAALADLPRMRERTRKYAETADFYRRADIAVDILENAARERAGS